jgi:hypothetical protein
MNRFSLIHKALFDHRPPDPPRTTVTYRTDLRVGVGKDPPQQGAANSSTTEEVPNAVVPITRSVGVRIRRPTVDITATSGAEVVRQVGHF